MDLFYQFRVRFLVVEHLPLREITPKLTLLDMRAEEAYRVARRDNDDGFNIVSLPFPHTEVIFI